MSCIQKIKTPSRPELALEEYPHAIAQAQTVIANLDATLAAIKYEMTLIEERIDEAVAFDGDLRNDGQRRAKRRQLLGQNGDYEVLRGRLKNVERLKAREGIRLTLLINQFSVAKLQIRQQISCIETTNGEMLIAA